MSRAALGLPSMRHAVLSIALLCAACASDAPKRDAALLAEYQKVAGNPVDDFFFWDLRNGWQVLGPEHLVVWTTPWDAYLLRVRKPCLDLQFAQTIAVTSTANTVHRGLDSIRVRDTVPCPIEEIRPVDYHKFLAFHFATKPPHAD